MNDLVERGKLNRPPWADRMGRSALRAFYGYDRRDAMRCAGNLLRPSLPAAADDDDDKMNKNNYTSINTLGSLSQTRTYTQN